jgi:hypothetical protein
MKFLHILTFIILVSFVFLSPTYAHVSGQPPFFKIDGKYSSLYPVPSTSLSDFNLPQDLAAENYLINQKLTFEIDTQYLQVPKEIISKTNFLWDFGDGQKGSGLKQAHTYKTQGSYVLTIDAKYDEIVGSQLIQSVLINILPNNNYQLPKPVIKINNRQSKDSLIDVLYLPFGTNLEFDASQSEASSSKIVSYTWDFGDSSSTNQPRAAHLYSKDMPQQQVFPVLRLKDSNGFIADTYVQITNDNQKNNNPSQAATDQPKKASNRTFLIIPIALLIMAIVGIILRIRKKKSSH